VQGQLEMLQVEKGRQDEELEVLDTDLGAANDQIGKLKDQLKEQQRAIRGQAHADGVELDAAVSAATNTRTSTPRSGTRCSS
jgi:archaellum component FlaC